jgi:hypothetical protein
LRGCQAAGRGSQASLLVIFSAATCRIYGSKGPKENAKKIFYRFIFFASFAPDLRKPTSGSLGTPYTESPQFYILINLFDPKALNHH